MIGGQILAVAFVTIAIWLAQYFWKRRDFFRLAARLPGPENMNFLRSTMLFVTRSTDESFLAVMDLFRTGPEIFKLWLGHILMVCISKPEHMEQILNNPDAMKKSPFIDFTKPYMGNGLFTAPMDIWKRHRKLINPVFNQKALNSFMPIFSEKSEILVEVLQQLAKNPEVDIFDKMSGLTLDTICENTMGLKVDAQMSDNRYKKLLERGMEICTERIFKIIYHPQIIFELHPIGREFYKKLNEINVFSKTIIAKRRADFEQKMRGEYIEENDDNRMKTLLELLLEISYNGNKFTDGEILDEVNTFISAGSDTTAGALSFCCMTLGMYPEYQQKLLDEAVEVLGEDRYPSIEDLPKLKFMEMFIKETLRIFPIGPLLVKCATANIKIDDLLIPEGSSLILSPLNLHRNPEYWPDPLKFDPYRFSKDKCEKRHPYSYLPFSGGPRNCIGYRYAMMLMKVVLSKIIRKFRFKCGYKSVEEIQLKFRILLRPTDGFKVSLELRE